MGFGKCGEILQSTWDEFLSLVVDIFIIVRKNLRIRRRRYMALLMEMLTPVMIAAFLANANTYRALLRVDSLEFINIDEEYDTNDTLKGFYDLGYHFDEDTILKYMLCKQPDDSSTNCQIGYVADAATKNAIFESPKLKEFFNETVFTEFNDEEELYACLSSQTTCTKLDDNSAGNSDPVLGLRGAIVFQTSVNAREVKYKIRLMEKYYGSLRHVLKTAILHPNVYDRREYSLSYIETGFLAVQFAIDRMIIEHIKSQTSSPQAAQIKFGDKTTGCTCEVSLYEIPHRQSDQFYDPQDPLELSDDYDIEEDEGEEDAGFHQRNRHDVDRLNQVNKQSLIVSTILVLSFTFLLPSEQRRIASEKENGLTILLLVTGMTHRMQWFGNLVAITLSYVPTITVVVALLTIKFDSNEGAVFEFASASTLWVLFFLYVLALASACYFTTVFFDLRATHSSLISRLPITMTAITASVSFWVASFVAPVYHVDYYYNTMPIWGIFIICLHPSVALQMALRLLIRFETHRVPTHVFTLSRFIPTDPLRIIFIVIILIIDAAIYMMLAIYLDRILKSKYGVTKPWYYIFNFKEYYSSAAGGGKVAPSEMVQESTPEQPGFEPCNESAEPTLITKNLTKKYGKKIAVEDLNFQLHHGEIFALLGENGSGKSTTLNLFSGFTPATSGTARICGYDIRTHMVQIQSFLGMCPQYSWLYDDLTAYEHLLIFGRLRGLRGVDAKEETMELLEKLRIHEMAHWTVRRMSRGDRRKVSLAIALVGNPRIVLLDEPTAGLDYYSRRAVWDLLLKIRSNHTIIFSTHFMDEAELLGDRIGILASGKMSVCGSHAFLRRHFGLGYSLKLETHSHQKVDKDKILAIVRESIPSASFCTLPISPNATRVCMVNLPMEGYSTASMSTLFSCLAQVKESLGIVGFSVSLSSIDEIFLELTRRLNQKNEEAIPIQVDDEEYDEEYDEEHREENIQRLFAKKQKMCHWIFQFYILFRKRMLNTWRNKKLFIFQVIIPFLIYIVGVLRLGSHVDFPGREGPPLELTINAYQGAITLYHADRDTFIKENVLKAVIGDSATYTHNSDLSGDYIHTNYEKLRYNHFVGVSAETGNKGQMFVHFSPYILHSSPIALSLFSNSLIKHMDINRKIITTNHPLQHPYFDGPNFEEDPYAPDVYSIMSTLSGTITVAFCVIFPIEERLTEVKHLQIMTGVSAWTYWLSTFLWDLIVVVGEGFILLAFSFFYEPLRVFAVSGAKDGTAIGLASILYSFLYSGIMFTYFISQFAHSKSGGFALLMSITLLFGILLPFLIFGIGNPDVQIAETLLWILQVVPAYALASAQRKYAVTLLGNGRCNHFTELGETRYCHNFETGDDDKTRRVTCCRNCVEIPSADDCYIRHDFTNFPWTSVKHAFGDSVVGPEAHEHDDLDRRTETRNIFFEILFMILVGLFFNCMVVFMDSDALSYLISCISGERGRAFQTNVDDDDVVDEMDHVQTTVDQKTTNTEALVAHNLCKTYGTYPAIHNISFRIHPGESLGIIGVNGAGKSTLFRLMTGAIDKTYGNIYSVDSNMNSNRRRLISKMGYAPQHGDATFDFMTCNETVILFGRLRGLSFNDAKKCSAALLKQIGLEQFADTMILYLSGGIKRRLSAVVAMITHPPIILLDEPTSAADPASRRAYWEIIKEVRKSGQTLVLSSHRIHECEDLCNRMVILVDGKFQCIGTPSHLKHKFGNGFKLIVKLNPGPAESQEYVSSLSESIVKIFNPCSLRDRRRNVVQYVIHNANISWEYLFQMMEHTKLRYNDLVEDYSFSNTTLEEVFLSFVVLQNCGRLLDQATGCCAPS